MRFKHKFGSLTWPYNFIVFDGLLLAFATLGFSYLVVSIVTATPLLASEENGVLETSQILILLCGGILGCLSAIGGRDRILLLCGALAFVAIAGFFREMPRCESVASSMCIPATYKRVLAIAALCISGSFLVRLCIVEHTVITERLHPRYSWPGIVLTVSLILSQMSEKLGYVLLEELLESYSYCILTLAIASLASGRWPVINRILHVH